VEKLVHASYCLINRVLGPFGLAITKRETLRSVVASSIELKRITLFLRIARALKVRTIPADVVPNIRSGSRSQLGQDMFALIVSGFKLDGFFVEFGATDGIGLSNTYILEKNYAWQGILAEPALHWHKSLTQNRKVSISKLALFSATGQSVAFRETRDPEISTISSFSEGDQHAKARRSFKEYQVNTISLEDLLADHNAPQIIDFLSMDTEGSEYSILEAFDFSKYMFRAVCIEHNYAEDRTRILSLMEAHGYEQVLSDVSDFDFWFVHKTLL